MSCEWLLTYHVMTSMSCYMSSQHYVIQIQMYYVLYTPYVYASSTWAVHVVYMLHVVRIHTQSSTQHTQHVYVCIHISCHVYRDTHTMYMYMCTYRSTVRSVTQVVLHSVYMYCVCALWGPCTVQYTVYRSTM